MGERQQRRAASRKVEVSGRKAFYEPWEWWSKDRWLEEWLRNEARIRGCEPSQISNTDVNVALAGAVLESPLFTARNFFFTRSKAGEVVLLDPFIGQIILDMVCDCQRRLGYAQRIIEIKPRQVGWTAWVLARGAWLALHPNSGVAFFVPDQKVVDDLNQRFGNIYNNLGWMAPMRRIDNKARVEFSNPNPRTREEVRGLESSITFAVPGPQRGRTPNMAVLCEFAFWHEMGFEADEVLDGLLSGMSAGPESCVIIDTTPCGYDEDYYPMVMESVQANPKWVAAWTRKTIPTRQEIVNGILGVPDSPDEGWVPAFSPWFWHEQYTTKDESPIGQRPKMTPKQRQHMLATLGKDSRFGGEEEKDLMKLYGVSIEQLFWRRWKISTDIQGYDARQKLLTFHQEYATTWDSCFVDFGNTAFDPLGMDAIRRMIKPPQSRGMLRRAPDKNGTIQWEIDEAWHSDWEEMRFWARSDPGEKYVIGADLGFSFETEEADETVAQVIRRRDRKQVAVYASRAPMHVVRKRIADLYFYYNRAFTGIETEGPGKNLVFELYQMGVTNQYKWKRLDREEVKDTDWLGWETGPHTRGQMEGVLCEEIAMRDADDQPDPGIILRDEITVRQLLNARRYPDGKIKARGSGHDDYMDALMIALAIDRDPMNPYTPPRENRQDLDDVLGSWLSTRGFGNRNKDDIYNPNLRDM
jgi:hypothetical protein